jgi:hypothetical protein
LKIPTRNVVLPFGYVIEVRMKTESWLRVNGYGRHGGWVDLSSRSGGIIYICRGDSLDEQLDTLVHEFGHAYTDWTGVVRGVMRRVHQEMLRAAIAEKEEA